MLRRLDCVLEKSKQDVLKEYKKLKAQGKPEDQIETILTHKFKINFYNTSEFTFQKLLGDPDGLAKNLSNYIAGFSTRARNIIEKFKFEEEIEKLDEANRLFDIFKKIAAQDLPPQRPDGTGLDNIGMGNSPQSMIQLWYWWYIICFGKHYIRIKRQSRSPFIRSGI